MNWRLLAFLLSVPALQGQGGWRVIYSSSHVCALRGSTVDISCSYEYPDYSRHRPKTVESLWFTKGLKYDPVDLKHDTDYKDRVQYSCRRNTCTRSRCNGNCNLSIKDLRLTDAAEYKFRFIVYKPDGKYSGVPGVTLSVTDLQVKVTLDPNHLTSANLQCHSLCALEGGPPYVWFRNGQSVQQGPEYYRVNTSSEDSYSCAVEGSEHLRSPSVYAPKSPSVSVSPSSDLVEGSSVTLSCSSDANPAANYTWFREHGDNSSTEMSQGPQLVFDPIQPSHAGQYLCQAQNELGTTSDCISIDEVKYGPRNTSVFSSPSGDLVEGSSVTLSCSSDANPAANYTWFREHGDRVEESGPDFTITNITAELGGTYSCRAYNAFGHHNSTSLFINVIMTPSSSSWDAAVSTGTIGALMAILLLVFLWIRSKRCSSEACGQRGRSETVEEPVFENISALTNHVAPAAQGEPMEQQHDVHYANVLTLTSRSENQEASQCWSGSRLQSDQTGEFLYSLLDFPTPRP